MIALYVLVTEQDYEHNDSCNESLSTLHTYHTILNISVIATTMSQRRCLQFLSFLVEH